jgi:hypothetical protein
MAAHRKTQYRSSGKPLHRQKYFSRNTFEVLKRRFEPLGIDEERTEIAG